MTIDFMFVFTENYPKTLEILLKNGANVNAITKDDDFGRTALDFALSSENKQIAKLLIQHGANVNIQGF